jgi:hypothetical protein
MNLSTIRGALHSHVSFRQLRTNRRMSFVLLRADFVAKVVDDLGEQ